MSRARMFHHEIFSFESLLTPDAIPPSHRERSAIFTRWAKARFSRCELRATHQNDADAAWEEFIAYFQVMSRIHYSLPHAPKWFIVSYPSDDYEWDFDHRSLLPFTAGIYDSSTTTVLLVPLLGMHRYTSVETSLSVFVLSLAAAERYYLDVCYFAARLFTRLDIVRFSDKHPTSLDGDGPPKILRDAVAEERRRRETNPDRWGVDSLANEVVIIRGEPQ